MATNPISQEQRLPITMVTTRRNRHFRSLSETNPKFSLVKQPLPIVILPIIMKTNR